MLDKIYKNVRIQNVLSKPTQKKKMVETKNTKPTKRLRATPGNISPSLRTTDAAGILKKVSVKLISRLEEHLGKSVQAMVMECRETPGKFRLLLIVEGDKVKAEELSRQGFDVFPHEGKGELRIWGIPTSLVSKKVANFKAANPKAHLFTKLNRLGQLDVCFLFNNLSGAETASRTAKEEGLEVRTKRKDSRCPTNHGFSILVPMVSDETSANQSAGISPGDENSSTSSGGGEQVVKNDLVSYIKIGLDSLPRSVVIEMLVAYLPEGVGLYNTKDPFRTNGVVSINSIKAEDLVS